MQIKKKHKEFDWDTRRTNWTFWVIADGRTWVVKGCTTADGAHTFGQVKPKDNESYGIHFVSQLAEEIRKSVRSYLDSDPLYWNSQATQAGKPRFVLSVETRAVLANVLRALGDERYHLGEDLVFQEGRAFDGTPSLSEDYLNGFAKAIDWVLDSLSVLTTKDAVQKIVDALPADDDLPSAMSEQKFFQAVSLGLDLHQFEEFIDVSVTKAAALQKAKNDA